LAGKLRNLNIEYEKKKATLKKLYLVHVHQTKQLEQIELDNHDFRMGMDKTYERNRELTV